MKAKIVIGGLVIALVSTQALAQENDDMYFRAKDREKLKAESATLSVNDKIDSDYKAFKKKHFDEGEDVAETVNPTDSYSARNVNPEYIARSNSEQASETEQNYYIEGYTPPTSYSSGYNNIYANNNSNWGYQNGWYNPALYNNMWYSPYYGYRDPWMSPYYGFNDPWMMNPYCAPQSGWTLSLSYGFGSMWGPSYGMGYGWGNSFYNPYYGYGYSPYSGWGYPTYYVSENSRVNYGKRPSRHSASVTPTRRTAVADNGNNANGRTRQQDAYYVRPSRRATTYSSEYNRDTRPTTDYSRSRTRDSFDINSGSRQSRPSYTPSPSRSSGSTPSRSSSSPSRSSGSSSGSRSRGGN